MNELLRLGKIVFSGVLIAFGISIGIEKWKKRKL